MEMSHLDVSKLALAYRRLVLWFGAGLVIVFFFWVPAKWAGEGMLGSALALILIGVLVRLGALMYYAYRTAVALGSEVPILWPVAILIPLLSPITLLVLSARATQACRQAGVPVGFFGPKVTLLSGARPTDPSISPQWR